MNEEQKHSGDGEERAGLTLGATDAAAVDAIVEGHGKVTGRPTLAGLIEAEMGPVDAARVARVQGWVDVMRSGAGPVASTDLVERTLAAVERDRMKMPVGAPGQQETRGGRRWWSRRLGDYVAMAIAASILVAVIIPGISVARRSARKTACASNLHDFANAFASYATADAGELPVVALPADRNWLPEGPGLRPVESTPTGHSNAANLLPLVNASYMPAKCLLCAGRELPGITLDPGATDVPENARGYSYANMYGAVKPRWDGQHGTIVLADRNPLFGAYVTDNIHANSFNHGGTGNYVVRADGAITWETSPDVGPDGDNIWTIGKQGQRMYVGTETVANVGDVFLAP